MFIHLIKTMSGAVQVFATYLCVYLDKINKLDAPDRCYSFFILGQALTERSWKP